MIRKSRREIERRVNELSDGPAREYPVVDSFARLWGYEWTVVDEDRELYENEDVPDQKYALAAFYGKDLEAVFTGNSPERYELVPRSRLGVSED